MKRSNPLSSYIGAASSTVNYNILTIGSAGEQLGNFDTLSPDCPPIHLRIRMWSRLSVTRLGNILDLWQLFKAFGNN